MEVGLRESKRDFRKVSQKRFNPCFNGSWSESINKYYSIIPYRCFNPCFNGSWSERRKRQQKYRKHSFVSILVLMEVGLRECKCLAFKPTSLVSILVLMEVGLRDCKSNVFLHIFYVSILVLMEVGLRVQTRL